MRSPIWSRLFTIAVLTGCVCQCAVWAGPAEETLRIVNGRVLNPDGTPSSGTMVYLMGIDRMGLMMFEYARKRPDWQWTTDAAGRFTARFADRRGGSLSDEGGPGWGLYHFVVLPGGNHAGGVSGQIANPWSGGFYEAKEQLNEWGGRKILGDSPVDIVVQLKKGIVVEGIVVDLDEQPISSASVGIQHDLHARTHTGYGGQIFERATTASVDGRFVFTGVHPAPFDMSAGVPGTYGVWIRTRLGRNGEWVEDRIDRIDVDENTTSVYVGIACTREGEAYRVSGVVTDSEGQPIAGAKISVGYCYHAEPKTWGDYHCFRETETDDAGQYEIRIDTPWIRFVRAEKEGYETGLAGDYDGAPLSPGAFPFTLEKGGGIEGRE